MVCMTLLKKKVDHGIAAGNAFSSLLCSTRPCKTLPPCSAPSLPTSTGGGCLGAGGKKARPRKKPTPPTTHTAYCSKRQQPHPITPTQPAPHFCCHSQHSIQWLYLCHCFLLAYALYRSSPIPNEQSRTTPSSVDSIQALTYELSNALDCKLLILDTAFRHLDEAFTALAPPETTLVTAPALAPTFPPPQQLATGKK
jgi:hypothetical protein